MPLLKASRHGQPPPLSNLVLGPEAEASFEGECISNDPSLVVLGIGYGVHTQVGYSLGVRVWGLTTQCVPAHSCHVLSVFRPKKT